MASIKKRRNELGANCRLERSEEVVDVFVGALKVRPSVADAVDERRMSSVRT